MRTLLRPIYLFALLAALAVSPLGSVHSTEPAVMAVQPPADPLPEPKTIEVVGDLQRASGAEQYLMAREDNIAQRQAVIGSIAKNAPDLLLVMGDEVGDAEDASDWEFFDNAFKPIRDAKIPVRAAIGNHDYGNTIPIKGIRELIKRFPNVRERPYVEKMGRLAILFFDSNSDQMSPGDNTSQMRNFQDALNRLDADPAISGIIVGAHHPPYSNSELGANDGVINGYANPFLKSKKGVLFLSGHVHSYERFKMDNRMFVVTGGGGGPRRTIDEGPNRPFHQDQFHYKSPTRPFNYVHLTVGENSIKGETRMLKQNGTFYIGDRFEVPLYSPTTTSVK